MSVAALCRKHRISDATFCMLRLRYGGMEQADRRPRSRTRAGRSGSSCLDTLARYRKSRDDDGTLNLETLLDRAFEFNTAAQFRHDVDLDRLNFW